MSTLTVSQLAKRAGVTPDTLRYYERIGILPAPERSPGGYRLYRPEDAERVAFVKRAQRFGLKLEAIGELLRVRDEGQCPCGHTRELLAGRLAELDEELAALTALRTEIEAMVERMPERSSSEWSCAGNLVQLSPTPPRT